MALASGRINSSNEQLNTVVFTSTTAQLSLGTQEGLFGGQERHENSISCKNILIQLLQKSKKFISKVAHPHQYSPNSFSNTYICQTDLEIKIKEEYVFVISQKL